MRGRGLTTTTWTSGRWAVKDIRVRRDHDMLAKDARAALSDSGGVADHRRPGDRVGECVNLDDRAIATLRTASRGHVGKALTPSFAH